MKYLDTELGWAWGRTPRELAIIAGGAYVTWAEATRPGTNGWHLSYYAVGTVAFAARFFAARAFAMAFLVVAAVLTSAPQRLGEGWLVDYPWWQALPSFGIGMLLLSSRDLRARFDRAPGGSGWRTNLWCEMPRRMWILSCLIGYSLGVLANAVLLPWMSSGKPGTWPLILLLAGYGALFLFVAGRSLAFLVAAVVGACALYYIVPEVAAAEAYAANSTHPAPDNFWSARPEYALPAAISAGVATLLSTPYALRHLWRSLIRPATP